MMMKGSKRGLLLIGVALSISFGTAANAAPVPNKLYAATSYSAANRTVTMSGEDLTIDQVLLIARDGAQVALTPAARKRSADAYGLLLEAAAEGVSVYWFNRGAGSQRETTIFAGDPTTAENDAKIRARQLASFGANDFSYGPEIDDEALARAIMAIRVNTMSYEAASPGLTQMLIELLNKRITPVIKRRGSLGEADISVMSDIGAAMIGLGEVYYEGTRMPAAQALAKAGLEPLQPAGADDSALFSTNAFAVAQAALLVGDAREILDWADLATAMALLGMNSSITPIAMPAQSNRPFPWLNWDAARVLDMVRGSYLLEDDPQRVIQDPESLRASTQRVGSAWQAWAELRDTVLISMNSSDHNPAVRPGTKPTDSWELSSPQMMRFYVKGGKLSHGQSGYILSTANWDPYPLANQVEGFTIALANMGVVLAQRIERFTNPFFTVASAGDLMPPDKLQELPVVGPFVPTDLWIELTGLITPVTPQGQAIIGTVEDLQSETRLKLARAREAVEITRHLLAHDILSSTNWVTLRLAQNRGRTLGVAPTAALAALRQVVPLRRRTQRTTETDGERIAEFLRTSSARTYYPAGPAQPAQPGL